MELIPNWKQSPETIEYDQQQQIQHNTERIDKLETKTSYEMLNVDDLETDEAYITTLNVASDSTLHDVEADDINCVNCDISGTLNADAVSDDLINTIFKAIYPIGSIYMTHEELTGPKTSSGNYYYVVWRGCKWQYLWEGVGVRYLSLSPKPTGSGSSWVVDGPYAAGDRVHNHTVLGATLATELGVSNIPVHSHVYGIKYGNMNGVITATDSTNMDLELLTQNGQWVKSTDFGSASVHSPQVGISVGTGIRQTITNTASAFGIDDYSTEKGVGHTHNISITSGTTEFQPQYLGMLVYKRVE